MPENCRKAEFGAEDVSTNVRLRPKADISRTQKTPHTGGVFFRGSNVRFASTADIESSPTRSSVFRPRYIASLAISGISLGALESRPLHPAGVRIPALLSCPADACAIGQASLRSRS